MKFRLVADCTFEADDWAKAMRYAAGILIERAELFEAGDFESGGPAAHPFDGEIKLWDGGTLFTDRRGQRGVGMGLPWEKVEK